MRYRIHFSREYRDSVPMRDLDKTGLLARLLHRRYFMLLMMDDWFNSISLIATHKVMAEDMQACADERW